MECFSFSISYGLDVSSSSGCWPCSSELENTPFPALLFFEVSIEKSAVIRRALPLCVICHSLLATLNTFSLFSVLSIVTINEEFLSSPFCLVSYMLLFFFPWIWGNLCYDCIENIFCAFGMQFSFFIYFTIVLIFSWSLRSCMSQSDVCLFLFISILYWMSQFFFLVFNT